MDLVITSGQFSPFFLVANNQYGGTPVSLDAFDKGLPNGVTCGSETRKIITKENYISSYATLQQQDLVQSEAVRIAGAQPNEQGPATQQEPVPVLAVLQPHVREPSTDPLSQEPVRVENAVQQPRRLTQGSAPKGHLPGPDQVPQEPVPVETLTVVQPEAHLGPKPHEQDPAPVVTAAAIPAPAQVSNKSTSVQDDSEDD